MATYKGTAFGKKPQEIKPLPESIQLEKLIALETNRIVMQYGNDCLNAQQLKQILNVGENHVYKLLGTELPYKLIGKRKVVPAIELVKWMLNK